ncbi:polysaccharide deacetylase family protein [Streptomyces sp. NPDC058108]|uniref:polysaccharide deacetylase family protein n=1 Tax=Streptomyces sp. NPDC058108 TaxID=3346344 RepID=UPI0036EEBDC3
MKILMYHLVQDLPGPMAVPPGHFREQMELLSRGPYTLIAEDDLHTAHGRGVPLPDHAVLLTFDDGYANTVTTALPVLEQFGLPAVMAVCGGYLTADRPRHVPHLVQETADLSQVQAWTASGRTVAAHSYTHRRLTGCTPRELAWQTAGDHEALTELLGRAPRTFAYPYGAYDPRVQRVVAGLYPLALATDEHHQPDLRHPYALSRIQVDPAWSIDAFRTALDSTAGPAAAQRAARAADAAAALLGGTPKEARR